MSVIDTLTPVLHNHIPVITTELLARLYGTDPHSITKNHRSNVDRFVAGKHFFKLEGADLKAFKNKVTDSDLVASRAKHLILWTERGAARHAKMLETDQAWEVFEKLEDCYFNVQKQTLASGKMNVDIFLAIREDKTAFIKSYAPGQLVTVDEALAILKARGWLVMPREELAGRLLEL